MGRDFSAEANFERNLRVLEQLRGQVGGNGNRISGLSGFLRGDGTEGFFPYDTLMKDDGGYILLILAGGTITSSAVNNIIMPEDVQRTIQNANFLLDKVMRETGVDTSRIKIHFVLSKDSTRLRYKDDRKITRNVFEKGLKDPECKGVIVACGTDSPEWLIHYLDDALYPNKPVSVIGAIKSAEKENTDAVPNIRDAIFFTRALSKIGAGGVYGIWGGYVGNGRWLIPLPHISPIIYISARGPVAEFKWTDDTGLKLDGSGFHLNLGLVQHASKEPIIVLGNRPELNRVPHLSMSHDSDYSLLAQGKMAVHIAYGTLGGISPKDIHPLIPIIKNNNAHILITANKFSRLGVVGGKEEEMYGVTAEIVALAKELDHRILIGIGLRAHDEVHFARTRALVDVDPSHPRFHEEFVKLFYERQAQSHLIGNAFELPIVDVPRNGSEITSAYQNEGTAVMAGLTTKPYTMVLANPNSLQKTKEILRPNGDATNAVNERARKVKIS